MPLSPVPARAELPAAEVVRPDGPRVATEATWVKVPSSPENLAGDSAAIVRATWTGETRWETVGSGDAALDFPISTMRVEQVIAGRMPGHIDVRMGVLQADGTSPLDTDREYLLFLVPFWFTPGEDTGQWTTADGPFGLYFGVPGGAEYFDVMPEGVSPVKRVTMAQAARLKVATVAQLKARA